MRAGFIIHGMTFFKAIGAIIEEAHYMPEFKPIIFCYKGLYGKPYDAASPEKFPNEFKNIKSVIFTDYSFLPRLLKKNKIDWLIGIEFALKIPQILDKIKSMGIKTCSIFNFTDGIWETKSKIHDLNKINLLCYQSKYLYDMHNKILNKYDRKNCIISGLPLADAFKKVKKYDAIGRYKLSPNYNLIMIPNLKTNGEYAIAFGSVDNFVKLIGKIHTLSKSLGFRLVAKSRRKQACPKEAKRFFDKFIFDDLYYPSNAFLMMNKARNVFIFNSLSVFEVAVCGSYGINISTNMGFAPQRKTKGFAEFFGEKGPYNFRGVNVTFPASDITGIEKHIGNTCDPSRLKEYKNKFILANNNSRVILNKILKMSSAA